MFEAAITNSPHKSCDIVIANAGISRASGDDLWPLDGKPFIRDLLFDKVLIHCFEDPNEAPIKPKLNIVNVNLIGSMYTWKLAVHYFRKQPDTDDRDRCFIITGSMVAWIDSPVSGIKLIHCMCVRLTMSLGKLAVYQQQVRAQRLDENCSTQLS